MPYSSGENSADVVEFVSKHNIKTVLDIGPGSGTYGTLLRPHVERIDAIEVWEPYVHEFRLKKIYDSVVIDDFRNWPDYAITGHKWDLIVFGDVLEHMTAEESKKVWTHAAHMARYGLISVPIIHYPQGAEFGNPYEVHVQEHLHPEDLREDYGPFVFDREYQVTGTFIRDFRS
jgi:predicted TPR repeat methyltransferase